MIEIIAPQAPTPAAEIPYIADPDLIIAAEVAMELGLPLLLTGEPGTGKTTFAQYLANRLAPAFFEEKLKETRPESARPAQFELHTFETKSTSVATDLFYRFDAVRRFQAIHDDTMSRNNRDYISFEALGLAILQSLPWNAVDDIVEKSEDHPGPRRSVVLIDEVDKAPRDFPNDILNEIQRQFFRIVELTEPGSRKVRSVTADPALRPIVVLTSNSEKNLPAPFLRRCVFHHIRFPKRTDSPRLAAIVRANLAGDIGALADSAIEFFYDVREQLDLDKLPTSAELVQWIRVLQSRRRFAPADHTKVVSLATYPWVELRSTLGVMAKSATDLASVTELAERKFGIKTRVG